MVYNPRWTFDGEMQPIQTSDIANGPLAQNRVPEEIAREAYAEYADEGHGHQSFERLHERGGFAMYETMILLYNRIKRLQGADHG